MGIFADKLKGTPLAYANAYLLLQRIKACEWGDPSTSEERMRAAYAAEGMRDIAVIHDLFRFYLDHYVVSGTPGEGHDISVPLGESADARQPDEGDRGHAARVGVPDHDEAAPSPSPAGDGPDQTRVDAWSNDVGPPPPSSAAARHSAADTLCTSARGGGAPTAAERAGARRAAASQAADVFEFKLRDGVKLGDVRFEDMNSVAEGSLFEATLMAMLRKEYPDAYGPVRKTVSVGALERMKLLAAKQAKRNAPSLVED